MSLPTVEAARAAMLATLATPVLERVSLSQADGRWLAEDVVAARDQPPFDASAMDGWAVRTADLDGRPLAVIGESAAGRGLQGPLGPGETVRIFTGAPLPPGADRVVIQEEADRHEGRLTVRVAPDAPAWVRPRGMDYGRGARLLRSGERLDPWRIALAASGGRADLACARRPHVAVLAGGDEVVEPGAPLGPFQINDAAGPGIAALTRRLGGLSDRRPLVGDTLSVIAAALSHIEADLIVTIGGASVGDHDLIKPAARALGADLVVEGVAMRPGKPVWFATLPDGRSILGLPGNPVSALVCGELFLRPVLAKMQGGIDEPRFETLPLSEATPGNGPRDHYARARVVFDDQGRPGVRLATDQDSALVTVLAGADALVRRPPFAPAAGPGDPVPVLRVAA